MSRRFSLAAVLVAVALLGAACESQKSSNPLSPSVAGPIPGVNITAPTTVTPTANSKIAVDQQPVTLKIQNASTSGVRPLNYLFEVATDAGFTNKVFSRDGITPGGDGTTAVTLPDKLAAERTYYWRAKAQDGANEGPYSNGTNFNVYTPIVIQQPAPTAPIGNVKVTVLHPTFTWTNAAHSGPVGPITYALELSDSDTFANKIAIWTTAEQSNQTSLAAPQDLTYAKQYFWHVRASDPTTTGPWSATQVFQTPDQPVVVTPPPSGGGGGGTPAANDQFNLSTAAVYNSPSDIASWPATGSITQLVMSPSTGLSFQFTTQNSWPDVVPPGWDGPLQYTVWAVVNVNGSWYTSGFIQMWRGRCCTGAPIISDFARNWAYDARWGPMMGHQPVPGERMGFFLSAGDARGQSGVSSVRERTNVVMVSLPAGDSGLFTFGFGSPVRMNFGRR